jgi:hypothetical protein
MKVYTWNIPEIYHFPIYDRYIPGIFHIYDTIQIPDVPTNPERFRRDKIKVVQLLCIGYNVTMAIFKTTQV